MKNNLQKKIDTLNAHEVIEQTFLSWVQTGLTLVGIGFGVGSVLAILKSEHYEKDMIMAIRVIGQCLIFIGFLTILLALFQHRKKIRSLADDCKDYAHESNLPLFIAATVALLGIAAFTIILLHIFLV